MQYRTIMCGEARSEHAGTSQILSGWVHRRRDHGGVIFLDVRDRAGIIQVTVRQDAKAAWEIANTARSEDVVRVEGKVVARPAEMVNQKIPTGEVELEVSEFTFLSRAKTPPFPIELDEQKSGSKSSVREELRMQYRYMDLRTGRPMRNLLLRDRVVTKIRTFLHDKGFIEVDTPLLTKSTPEGARDFLVPSRLHPGSFYALPQSPQQYKQLLMLGGLDRYFQIARCLRDEDQRGQRQPEFTQLDLETSFPTQEEILTLIETLYTQIVRELFPEKKIQEEPWPRLTYDDVMLRYGTDKPDLRFGLEIVDVTTLFSDTSFAAFRQAIDNGGAIRAFVLPDGAKKLSRAMLASVREIAKQNGIAAIGEICVKKDGVIESPLGKFVGKSNLQALVAELGAASGDMVFIAAGKTLTVCAALGAVRAELGKLLKLVDDNVLAFAFILDFPLFEPEKVGGHFAPSHHMFTAPKEDDLRLLETNPERVRSYQHDLVLNGHEVGGGSIRIHDRKLQEKIFELIGFSKERKQFFAHILEAFEYGAPPHGGIAMGLDRLLAVLLDEPDIREVIAFPKTGDGRDLLMGAPAPVEPEQLKELHIEVREHEKHQNDIV